MNLTARLRRQQYSGYAADVGIFEPKEIHRTAEIVSGQGRKHMNANASFTRWAGTLAAPLLIAVVLSACSDDSTPPEDGAMLSPVQTPVEDTATLSQTPPTSSDATATPATPGTSGMSIDEYLAACGGPVSGPTDEDVTLKEFGEALGEVVDRMESVDPPGEVSDYHDVILAYQKDLEKAIDDAPGPGRAEDEYILNTLLPLGLEHQPAITEAIAVMDPAVRNRLVAAGCIDDEVGAEQSVDSTELTVGEAAIVVQDEPSQTDRFTFQAERGQRYLLEVVRDTLPDFGMTLPAPDGELWQNFISADERPELSLRWEASGSGAHYFLVTGDEAGAGSYSVAVLVDPSPRVPSNVRYAWDGSSIRVSWDPVAGADYYKVYYDDFFPEGCRLNRDGSTSFCEELATNVLETFYVHADPDIDANYYWAAACNGEGCSDVALDSAAPPQTAVPEAPSNFRHDRDDTAIRIAWGPVDGADFYMVYHFFVSDCDLSLVGRPGFCERLDANVSGTSYVHANPDSDQVRYLYWVTACNSGGCSQIESRRPDISIENPTAVRQPTPTAEPTPLHPGPRPFR